MLALVAFWTAVGFIFITAESAAVLFGDRPFSPTRPFWILAGWYTWIPASVVALYLARRFPIRRATWKTAVPLHVVGAVANSLFACVLYTAMRGAAAVLTSSDFEILPYLKSVFLTSVGLDSFIYLMILVGVHGFEFYRLYSDERVRAAHLAEQLTNARLEALKMQLHPHFLFNTFNSISMLVRRHEEKQAVGMITRLSDFFRFVLDHADLQEVTLSEEMMLLKSYLAIEKIRFGERLDAKLDVEEGTEDAYVPTLLLQPLVENAIRHGIEPVSWPGVLVISVSRHGPRLTIQVRDNGRGLPEGWTMEGSRGVGLNNTRLRLARMYDDGHIFSVDAGPEERGSVVNISIPFRTAPSHRDVAEAVIAT